MKEAELAILVYSCAHNSDMWPIFTQLFRKYWPDCKFPLILLTDKMPIMDYDVSVGFDEVNVLDSTWYDMIISGIEKAKTRYVSLWMDDYLLCDYVRNEDIGKQITNMKAFHCGNIRFMKSPMLKPIIFPDNKDYEQYVPGTAYSLSTQVGIWDVKFLKKILRPEWSAWDFERVGSIEIKEPNYPLLGTRFYEFPYVEGVRKGKWMKDGVSLCVKEGIDLSLSNKPIMTRAQMAWIEFKGSILKVNPTLVQKIQNVLNIVKKKMGNIGERKDMNIDLWLKVLAHRITEPVLYKKRKNSVMSSPLYKRKLVEKIGKKYECSVLIETGTYLGEMPEYQRNNFKDIYSIEITEIFSKFSRERLKKYPNISIIKGDSGLVLSSLLEKINPDDRILFWLDGHYSGGKTGRGEKDCPIFEELTNIFELRRMTDILLIDDAREFNDIDNGYPSLNELSDFIHEHDAKAKIVVRKDIIRVLL